MKFSILLGLLLMALYCSATMSNDATCINCHKQEQKAHENNIHFKSWKAKGEGVYGCASCHGDGTRHAKMADPDKASIIGFGQKSPAPINVQNEQCLSCHKNSPGVKFWLSSKHSNRNVSCASCHSDHKPTLEIQKFAKTESCLECHRDRKTEFSKYSHHPVQEGKMTCVDCHNPHGSMGHKMLKGNEIIETCTSCHSDKRGPFLWEHQPVQENCLNCHTPHGGNHDKLLKKRAPLLCQDCHTGTGHQGALLNETGGFEGSGNPQIVGRACIECHSKIHGSHAPQDPRSSNRSRGGKFFLR